MSPYLHAKESEYEDTALSGLTPQQLTAEYLDRRRILRNLNKRAKRISMGSAGVWVEENRRAYSSLIFTRISVTGRSIEQLSPNCAPREHWDFSAVASLARNLAEAYLWYFWLCEDDVDPDIRQGRFVLLYCHDHGSRVRLFRHDNEEVDDSLIINDFNRRFDENPWLRTLSEKARRELIRGHKTPFLQDDVLDRMGQDKDHFRFMYRFFSQHTHTGPVSFFRMFEHDRGKGVETEHEKRYMILALQFASGVMERAIAGHLKLFPNAETRTPPFSERDVVKAVERNQGRTAKA